MKFDPQTRVLIIERAKQRCEICGSPAPMGQIHHRRPRGMGGSRLPETGGAANGLYLHAGCHRIVESDRAAAFIRGWLVRQGDDPATIPVRLHSGWCVLGSDGQIVYQTDSTGS
jgi:5-methylcytosine-specific restriction protein A